MKNILLSLTLFYAAVSVCAIVKALREPFEQPGLVRLRNGSCFSASPVRRFS